MTYFKELRVMSKERIGSVFHHPVTFLTSGSKRSVKAKKNILLLGILKVISISIGLVQVPIILHYLNAAEYGVWLTLSSMVGWILYFDVGLGHGLRNKLAEALATGEHELARIYVSTTYFLISIIVAAVLIFFLGINYFLDWQKILNISTIPAAELNTLFIVVFVFFCLRFIFSLISIILTADQEPAKAGIIEVSVNLLSLAAIYGLTKLTKSSLLTFGIVQSIISVIVPVIASIWFFGGKYRHVYPSFRFVKFKFIRSLANLGVQFFVIQIAGLVIFSTSNIIIANLLGPTEVTAFNISFKYFSVITIVFGIAVTPFWSAFTDAYVNNEIAWIKSSIRRLVLLWGVAAVAAVVMLFFSQAVYHLWIGESVIIPVHLSTAMAVFTIISNWNSIFVSFLNGTGKIRLQLYNAVVIGIINIPLALVLVQYFHWGSAGVVGAMSFCLFIGSIWAPIQYRKLISNTATGLWNK